MNTSNEPITSQTRSTEALAPIRAWAKSNPGAVGELAAEVSRITGEPANRHMVGRWLRETDAVQPRFGYGLALIQAYENLAKESKSEAPTTP